MQAAHGLSGRDLCRYLLALCALLVMLRGGGYEVEAQDRAARAGLSDQGEPRALGRGPPDFPGEGGT
jgi:hypothetical protein